MNKSKHSSIVLVLIVIVVIVFSIQYAISKNESSSEIISEFKHFLYQYDNFDDELPVLFSNDCDDPSKKIPRISKSEALEDIEYLFSLLKYGYSGYEYFGGDEKFNSAKENIIWSIVESKDLDICTINLLDIIYYEIKFIQDSHFTIGNYKLCNYMKYFSSRKFSFYEDNNGFYTYIDKVLYYLKEIDQEDPTKYMKQTLDENGDLVFNIGVLSDTSNVSIPLTLLFKSENNIREENLSLFEYIPLYKEESNSYNYYEIDGIPVLDLNCLCRVTPEDNSIEDFIADSKKMRYKDLLIIDLRNNNGGSMVNVEDWYKGFTGVRLKKDIIQSGLYTNTSVSLSKHKFKVKENESDETKDKCLEVISGYENEKYFPGWSSIKYEDFQPPENKVKVFILLDKSTASASEFFTYYLSKLDNVTLVGTNTNGCVLTGNCNSAYLPHSKIPLHISHKIYMSKEFNSIEGLGLFPDLWIKPDQALDRVIKYIKKNK